MEAQTKTTPATGNTSTLPGAAKRFIAFLLLFLLGFGIPLASSYYAKNTRSREELSAKLEFPSAKAGKPVMIDLAQQGTLKRIYQRWTLRTNGSVINQGDAPHRVRLELEGNPFLTSWHVQNRTWDKATQTITTPLLPKEKTSFNIFYRIPEDLRRQAVIYDGVLTAVDPETGEVLASTPFKVVNSQLGDSAASTGGAGAETPHGAH